MKPHFVSRVLCWLGLHEMVIVHTVAEWKFCHKRGFFKMYKHPQRRTHIQCARCDANPS